MQDQPVRGVVGRGSEPRRGAVLIIVLGVLVVLLLLATTFAGIQGTERQVSRNYVDEVRARLVAMAGVEYAVAQVTTGIERADFADPAMVYWGNNLTEQGPPDDATPLEWAQNPSYAWEDEASQNPSPDDPNGGKPMQLRLDGADVGLSGALSSGNYGPHGEIYRLKVTDANSQIHLNDGVENGNTGYVSQNLKLILNNLCDVVATARVGDRIVDQRPAGGYRSKREVERVVGSAPFAKLRPFVTTQAWVDPNVVNPVPISRETLRSYPVKYNERIGLFRYGNSYNSNRGAISMPLRFAPDYSSPLRPEHGVVAMDALNAGWIERCGRAPVNVNRASSEVLTALLTGLQGVFLVERRKTNPAPYNLYSFLGHIRYDNAPGGSSLGDEVGFLYSTFAIPITLSRKVAAEIIACRSRRRSPANPKLDYDSSWFGGPFKTWRQFHAFCDALVEFDILQDPRRIYFDYVASPKDSSVSGSSRLTPSTIQQKYANQALADVLKANFNPNCTLNEINPDANLALRVDKTDLIRNSTEFCFTPMGYFEIESEGLVVRPEGQKDLLVVRKGNVIARKKIAAVVKMFDVLRDTMQKDFHPGKISSSAGTLAPTNLGRTLDLGPEPDNGKPPVECGWSGWIQLATVGGEPQPLPRLSDEPRSTPKGAAERGAVAHGHFTLDHRLHHHAADQEEPIRKHAVFYNNPDRTEGTNVGPYGPTTGAPGRYRLARNWSLKGDPPTPDIPSTDRAAVGDLRIDGAYVERDSALLYACDDSVMGHTGTAAFWLKPSFRPEHAGKPRTFFSVDSAEVHHYGVIHGLWFFASHDTPPYAPSPNETGGWFYWVVPSGIFRPMSIAAGFSLKEGWGGGVGSITPALNHQSHRHGNNPRYPYQFDYLRAHGWTHVAYLWNFGTKGEDEEDHSGKEAILLINGQRFREPVGADIFVHPENEMTEKDLIKNNAFRLGEPSTTMKWWRSQTYMRNWAADATIDEFYLWKEKRPTDVQDLYQQGRYYVPRAGSEAVFTSREISFEEGPLAPRHLPPAAGRSEIEYPTTTAPSQSVRILGASWTWYGESVSDGREPGSPPVGTPVVHDYNRDEDLAVRVELGFLSGGQRAASGLTNDGGGGVGDVAVTGTSRLQYEFTIVIPGAALDTLLLATPVIDDITLYCSTGVEFLSYELLEVAL